jgi:O-antigen/teichoic acid export membrane protein
MISIRSEIFRQYFANTSWLFLERAVRMAVGFVVGAYVARYLGPDDFGIISYALSISGLFLGLSTMGLDAIVVKELVQGISPKNAVLGTAFWIRLTGTFTGFFILLVVSRFHSGIVALAILITGAAMFFQAFNVEDLFFQSKVLSKYVVFAQIIQVALSSSFKICLIFFGATLCWFAFSFTFEAFVLALALSFFYVRQNGNLTFLKHFDALLARQLLRESWPLILSSMVVSLYMQIDRIMLQQLLDMNAVGIYSAAARLTEIWYFIPVLCATSVFPALSKAKTAGDAGFEQLFQMLHDFLFGTAIVLSILFFVFAHEIVGIVFGEAYEKAGSVLKIHVWASVFIFTSVARGKYLVLKHSTKTGLYQVIIGSAVNIALNCLLIPIYGVMGAAISTLIARIGSFYVAAIFFSEMRELTKYMHRSCLLPVRLIFFSVDRIASARTS